MESVGVAEQVAAALDRVAVDDAQLAVHAHPPRPALFVLHAGASARLKPARRARCDGPERSNEAAASASASASASCICARTARAACPRPCAGARRPRGRARLHGVPLSLQRARLGFVQKSVGRAPPRPLGEGRWVRDGRVDEAHARCSGGS